MDFRIFLCSGTLLSIAKSPAGTDVHLRGKKLWHRCAFARQESCAVRKIGRERRHIDGVGKKIKIIRIDNKKVYVKMSDINKNIHIIPK